MIQYAAGSGRWFLFLALSLHIIPVFAGEHVFTLYKASGRSNWSPVSTIILNTEYREGSVVSTPLKESLSTASLYEQLPLITRREIKSPVARCPDKKQKSFLRESLRMS
ncbi:MAG: hypothetical protein ACR2PX_16715 [Endozoicomonas sp.]|uniref:hypothetical protein n=1 Tax=Endozoicomonas sp. TaxID=1892382 RepID=UPI003D9BF9F3